MASDFEGDLRKFVARKASSQSLVFDADYRPSSLGSLDKLMQINNQSGTARSSPTANDSGQSSPNERKSRTRARRAKSALPPSKPKIQIRRNTLVESESLDAEESYNPFLKKVPSAGKIYRSNADSDPYLRKSSSQVGLQSSSANYDPLPSRISDLRGNKSLKNRSDQPPTGLPKSSLKVNRNSSMRRSNQSVQGSRKSNDLLIVPSEESDAYTLRSFDLSSKGHVINRGDSVRRRQSRSHSLTGAAADNKIETKPPVATVQPSRPRTQPPQPGEVIYKYHVILLGQHGVGKGALIDQFMSSECIDAYDDINDSGEVKSVHISLNGEISEIVFEATDVLKSDWSRSSPPDGFILCYSIIDKASLQQTEDYLLKLQQWDLLRGRPSIIVGNKVDLVRKRDVSPQAAKSLAVAYKCKWMEISVAINHNVDELLVGLMAQLRLYAAQQPFIKPPEWQQNPNLIKMSKRIKRAFTKMLGYASEDSAYKNCENLHIL